MELISGIFQGTRQRNDPFPEIHDSIYQLLEPYLKEDSNDVEIHIFKQGMKIRVKINLHNVHHEIIQKLLEDKPQMLYLLKNIMNIFQ